MRTKIKTAVIVLSRRTHQELPVMNHRVRSWKRGWNTYWVENDLRGRRFAGAQRSKLS